MTDAQWLRFLPGLYVVEQCADVRSVPEGRDWLAMVRAPEGLTVIRRLAGLEAAARGSDGTETWVALYGGDTGHDLDVPGMLCALLLPLKQAEVPVFVASTYRADVVLVPSTRQAEAVEALRAAGHRVDLDTG